MPVVCCVSWCALLVEGIWIESYFLFLQEQIKGIIIGSPVVVGTPVVVVCRVSLYVVAIG